MPPSRPATTAARVGKPARPRDAAWAVAIVLLSFYALPLLAYFLVKGEYRQYLVYLDYVLTLSGSIIAVAATRRCNAWVLLVAGLTQWPVAVLVHAGLVSVIESASVPWDFIVPNIIKPYGVPLHAGFLAAAGGVATYRAFGMSVKRAFRIPPWHEWLESGEKALGIVSRIINAWKTIYTVVIAATAVVAFLATVRGCR
jgi:hypothetical protein